MIFKNEKTFIDYIFRHNINDIKLTRAGMRIHEKLKKDGFSDRTDAYWIKLELNLYKQNKNDLLEHYSHGN